VPLSDAVSASSRSRRPFSRAGNEMNVDKQIFDLVERIGRLMRPAVHFPVQGKEESTR